MKDAYFSNLYNELEGLVWEEQRDNLIRCI